MAMPGGDGHAWADGDAVASSRRPLPYRELFDRMPDAVLVSDRDARCIGDGAYAFVIGDVCGKGPKAAALMGAARHTIRTAAPRDLRPGDALVLYTEGVTDEQWEGEEFRVDRLVDAELVAKVVD